MKKKVVVGMSGGVDSSAAACLLLEQGYEVIGATARLWRYEGEGAPREDCAVNDARLVADYLGIPHYILDYEAGFRLRVVDYFVREYLRGRTPNPCIVCNRFVKWECLMSIAGQLSADYIATGHYARIRTHPETGRLCVACPADSDKDQSYALYALTREQLAVTLFPLGEHKKDWVRDYAAGHSLPAAQKPDSQDICFLPGGDYARFIAEYSPENPPGGYFIDEYGHTLGRHKGIAHYTIGQRKGLGMAFGKPMYVKRINASDNTVMLSEYTYMSEMTVNGISWMAYGAFGGERQLRVKIRYNHKAVMCTARAVYESDTVKICSRFGEPQKAVTPGQAAVFYDGDYIVFGGVIE